MSRTKTYVSLFSSAGVGCYGFKLEGFECVSTIELIERRLQVQKYNNKCKYESGYICGDITLSSTKDLLYKEIQKWEKKEKIKNIDVVIATPPCQGMSVANHKKNDKEIVRNSLVIESIKIIKKIHPTYFVFENVPAFMKTICTDCDGKDKTIADAIDTNLGEDYVFVSKIINFKNYGACSSRSRTVVIGVLKSIAENVSPAELFPNYSKEKTLREVIGDLPSLNMMGEIDESDIYHFFRKYPEHMRSWIHDLQEGQSAFDNTDDMKKPHQIIDGEIIININKNADKYTRQYWDKVGPCVHTRNDQLASQNTIHPVDDRVFSIRELMLMMTVPFSFKWSQYDLDYLNALSIKEKEKYLKKEEIKIRQSLGEAVPTIIFQSIAKKIANSIDFGTLTTKQIKEVVEQYKLYDNGNLFDFIKNNPLTLGTSALSRVAELANTKRTDNAAYYTNKFLITKMLNKIEIPLTDNVRILEPSVGVGNFIPFIVQKFEDKIVTLDVIDIDPISLKIAKLLIEKYDIPENVKINYIQADFLTYKFKYKYDFIIGNPPFYKLNDSNKYKKNAINKETNNICSYFLDKALSIADFVLNYIDNINEVFTPADIWHSDYAKLTIAETYSKPGTNEKTAQNEYDKVFSQPLWLFCYSGIIEDISKNNRHLYKVVRKDILEYIATNDIYALRFLQLYIEKVLKDSDLLSYFLEFFEVQDKNTFRHMKNAFIDFYHRYTPVQKEYEPKRIFTKVINPLAHKYGKHGSYRGNMSPYKITKADMMYNQDNFRDVYEGKPKDVTRQDWLKEHPVDIRYGYFNQMLSHAKNLLKDNIEKYRSNVSELTQFIPEQNDNNNPTQIHHIFPKNEFPEIMHYIENLIALTPNQHFGYAHPNNNTQYISLEAQKMLLIAKTYSVKKNLESTEEVDIYDFDNLLYVLHVGWSNDDVLSIEKYNFTEIIHQITYHYASLNL